MRQNLCRPIRRFLQHRAGVPGGRRQARNLTFLSSQLCKLFHTVPAHARKRET